MYVWIGKSPFTTRLGKLIGMLAVGLFDPPQAHRGRTNRYEEVALGDVEAEEALLLQA